MDANDVVMNDPGMVIGGRGFDSTIHEVGHALGLSHPGHYDASLGTYNYAHDAAYAQDTRQYTVMSYFGYYDTTLNGGKGGWAVDAPAPNDPSKVTNELFGADGGTDTGRYIYPQTPMVDDVAAIQAKYGADTTTRPGDTIYGFNCNITPTAVANITVDESQIYGFGVGKNQHPIFTIWDSGGYTIAHRLNPHS
jgi:hypothetical protein